MIDVVIGIVLGVLATINGYLIGVGDAPHLSKEMRAFAAGYREAMLNILAWPVAFIIRIFSRA